MATENQNPLPDSVIPETPGAPLVKIFGAGNAGAKLLGALATAEFAAAQTAIIDTDAGGFAASGAIVKIQLENRLLRGLGSGGDPDRAKALAEEQFSTLKAACEGAGVVFILAGLGGGAGSGISPILARAAREAGALVLAFVTLPFDCEGNRREAQAQAALEQLKAAADGVICLPSQKIFKLIDENTSLVETFSFSGGFLIEGVRGVWQLLTRPGLIQVHFADLCGLLRDRHAENVFAFVEASGAGRSREVVEKILAHPLLDEGRALADADAVLVSLLAGTELTMAEVNRVMEQVKRQCSHAQIMMGAAIDPDLKTKLCVTIIAGKQTAPSAPTRVEARTGTSNSNPAGKNDIVMTRPARPRRAGGAAKAVQTQLPLTIISKGRFDKSEPTLHHGEDLDVPTFIRRGIPLN
ncbi:MAG TPA: cell division protein FtsZ [Opitutaceae bacterium]|jgi:cell division protein FtsZ|nr:cell division protein FtsZ [Opitutaceae bacterium]